MKKLILLCTVFLGCVDNVPLSNSVNKQSSEEQIMKNMIIGDLGGVPVDIPKELVRLVEYDGDPDWGEIRKGAVPERTYQSKINSFGFDIRYTDSVIYDGIGGKISEEYDAQKNLPDSPWVSVGINSGNRYHSAGGIHRMGNDRINNDTYPRHPVFKYEKLPELQYGLEVYVPQVLPPKL